MIDDPHESPPPDVVPRRGLTLETLAALDRMAGRTVTVTEPGEILLDPDGIPCGVGASTTTSALMARACVSRAELESLGGNPADYPNISFI